MIVYKTVTDCVVTGCPQNKKNEVKGILLLDFELFIGAYKAPVQPLDPRAVRDRWPNSLFPYRLSNFIVKKLQHNKRP
jgi:hypothetical protein